MPNINLLSLLNTFVPIDDLEREMVDRTVAFVEANENCMNRSLQIGHITGSAWIVDADSEFVLLTHHAKLNRWLQLGGHAEGESLVVEVAMREAQEESGLASVRLVHGSIFSVDVHPIPARKDFPEHLHYDVRFLFVADRNEPLQVSDESHALRWIALQEVHLYNDAPSIMRMVERTLNGFV